MTDTPEASSLTDRELLELAAKAAGIDLSGASWGGGRDGFYWVVDDQSGRVEYWSPLTDDGDAFRLAVTLDLLLMPYPRDKAVRVTRLDQPDTIVSWGTPPDPYAATRRAIVRAAAEIGRAAA